MRLRLLIAGLSAVLFLSGWGGVFASAECHGAGLSAGAKEEHACCHTKTTESASSSSHCSSMTARPSFIEGSLAVSPALDACEHCFVRSENPPARFALSEPHVRRRGDATHGPRAWNPCDAMRLDFRAVVYSSRGGAPPGATPKALHLLHGVFLI